MNSAHLDDETLSAVLDGEADETARTHVAGCGVCAARVAEFRSIAAAIGAATESPSGLREAAIRAALLEAAPPEDAKPSSLDLGRERVRRRSLRSRPPLVTLGWAGIAAAVVALLVAIPALLGSGRSKGGGVAATATAPLRGPAQTAAGADLPATTPSQGGSLSHADGVAANRTASATPADLGAQTNQSVLANVLHAALAAPAPGAPVGPSNAFATSNGSSTTTNAPTTSPALGSASPQAAVVTRCSPVAATDNSVPTTAKPVYVGLLDWKGTAAAVYVFVSGNHHIAAVMSQSSCQMLVSFAL